MKSFVSLGRPSHGDHTTGKAGVSQVGKRWGNGWRNFKFQTYFRLVLWSKKLCVPEHFQTEETGAGVSRKGKYWGNRPDTWRFKTVETSQQTTRKCRVPPFRKRLFPCSGNTFRHAVVASALLSIVAPPRSDATPSLALCRASRALCRACCAFCRASRALRRASRALCRPSVAPQRAVGASRRAMGASHRAMGAPRRAVSGQQGRAIPPQDRHQVSSRLSHSTYIVRSGRRRDMLRLSRSDIAPLRAWSPTAVVYYRNPNT